MKDLYLIYDESRSGGHLLNPEQEWSSREDTIITWEPKYLSRARPKVWLVESIPVTDDLFNKSSLILITVRYSDGDTFGRSSGNWHIIGLYDDQKEIDVIDRKIRRGVYPVYRPWDGYFARFSNVQTDMLEIIN